MLKLLKPASPEDLFVERYDSLLGWALALTKRNRSQAEDLVHDAFLQFTHRRGDLAPIENTDAYLHRMLRNMYLSEVRRAGVIHNSRFSIADFDSAEMGLRAFRANDPSEHLDLQDQLRQICQYVCSRKQTSKAASVLILRFFHGYYPSEIAQVLRTTRMAVDRWLQISRREAKAYLNDPTALKFMSESRSPNLVHSYSLPTTELLGELREAIFASRRGDCLSSSQLKERYREAAAIDGVSLSHVVSCARCLDTVNRLLGLPLLAERSSDERLGRDVPPDNSGGSGAGGSGTSIMEPKKKYERREKEVMEHRPQELRIAVNGFMVGTQQVSSELSKLALTVNVDEPIGFIEVFSEQAVRLLFFDVEQPTDGSVEQSAGVDFDCGRSLDLSLSFRGPWPALNVSYLDPTFEAVTSGADFDESSPEAVVPGDQELKVLPGKSLWSEPLTRTRSLLGSFDWRMFLRPGAVTALISVLLVAAIVLLYRHVPNAPISAADLLGRAAASEHAIASNRDQVVHRLINLEEKNSSGQLVARHRIEVWHSAEKGITARRLYDQRGQLVAGDWRREDGVQTLYHHGMQPKLQPLPEKRPEPSLDFENVWQLSPSANEFSSLIANIAQAQVDENAGTYVISYDGTALQLDKPYLIRANLVLNRSDLRATEQTLHVQQGDETREYRFIETSFERHAPSTVPSTVFEPEPELLSSRVPETRNPKSEAPTLGPLSPYTAATAELEVELLERLNQVGAFLGEQITVSRSADGQLRVEGVIDTSARKAEIVRALGPLTKNPSVRVAIDTVAEAQARQSQRQQQPSTVTLEGVEVTEQRIAVDAELRAFLQGRGLSGDQLEVEMRRFSDRVLQRSLQARLHARALKQIVERFSALQLATLDSDARARWRAMINQHARACQQDIERLRHEMQPLFPNLGGSAVGESAIIGDDMLLQAITRLYALSVANDESLRRSFSLYAEGARDAPARSSHFWRSLRSAEALAGKIAGSK